jgi:hypothetical protein
MTPQAPQAPSPCPQPGRAEPLTVEDVLAVFPGARIAAIDPESGAA